MIFGIESPSDSLALLRKSLVIHGAGEGNRTLVIITKVDSLEIR